MNYGMGASVSPHKKLPWLPGVIDMSNITRKTSDLRHFLTKNWISNKNYRLSVYCKLSGMTTTLVGLAMRRTSGPRPFVEIERFPSFTLLKLLVVRSSPVLTWLP